MSNSIATNFATISREVTKDWDSFEDVNKRSKIKKEIFYSISKYHDKIKFGYKRLCEKVKAAFDDKYSITDTSIPIGFRNPKLYCYLNSILQMLYACEQFRNGLILKNVSVIDLDLVSEDERNDLSFTMELSHLFMALIFQDNDMVQQIVQKIQTFFTYESFGDDIHKCFLNIINRVKRGLIKLNEIMGEDEDDDDDGLGVINFFKGQYTYRCVCKNCEAKKFEKTQIFCSLPLNLPFNKKEVDFESCFLSYFAETSLEMDSDSSLKCCARSSTVYQTDINDLPKYLFVYLMRGAFNNNESKNNVLVTFDDGILIPTYNGTRFYRIKVIIEHIGTNEFGHYYVKSLVKDKWWKISDYSKTRIEKEELITENITGILLELEESTDVSIGITGSRSMIKHEPEYLHESDSGMNGVESNNDEFETIDKKELENESNIVLETVEEVEKKCVQESAYQNLLRNEHVESLGTTKNVENQSGATKNYENQSGATKNTEIQSDATKNDEKEKEETMKNENQSGETTWSDIDLGNKLEDSNEIKDEDDEICSFEELIDKELNVNYGEVILSIFTCFFNIEEFRVILNDGKKFEKKSSFINNMTKATNEFQENQRLGVKSEELCKEFQKKYSRKWINVYVSLMNDIREICTKKNEITNLFYGFYSRLHECVRCHSTKTERVRRKFLSLNLPKQDYVSFDDLVSKGFCRSVLQCNSCSKDYTSKLKIDKPPQYLFIYLDRNHYGSEAVIYAEDAYLLPVKEDHQLFSLYATIDYKLKGTDKEAKEYIVKSNMNNNWLQYERGKNTVEIENYDIFSCTTFVMVLKMIQ